MATNKQVYILWKGVKVMRKLLILMVVFGVASAANAALKISVNGNPDPQDTQYYLDGSKTIKIDVWTTTDIMPGIGERAGWAIVTGPKAQLTGGRALLDDPSVVIYPDAAGAGVPGLKMGENGPWGSLFLSLLPSIPAGTVIFDEIILHCSGGAGDQLIRLIGTDWAGHDVVDSVIIHQIPEPMTVALLGLGGLFLLRRRK
jgi:hypothetical protein